MRWLSICSTFRIRSWRRPTRLKMPSRAVTPSNQSTVSKRRFLFSAFGALPPFTVKGGTCTLCAYVHLEDKAYDPGVGGKKPGRLGVRLQPFGGLFRLDRSVRDRGDVRYPLGAFESIAGHRCLGTARQPGVRL